MDSLSLRMRSATRPTQEVIERKGLDFLNQPELSLRKRESRRIIG
jgi:hypothetical protein